MVKKISAKSPHKEFRLWLEQVKEVGFGYEIVIENGEVARVYVREGDDGDWSLINHGRVFGTKVISFKQRVFLPRLIDDKFIADYNGKG
jgi:hypothetical protein